jgi:hypothetical protein
LRSYAVQIEIVHVQRLQPVSTNKYTQTETNICLSILQGGTFPAPNPTSWGDPVISCTHCRVSESCNCSAACRCKSTSTRRDAAINLEQQKISYIPAIIPNNRETLLKAILTVHHCTLQTLPSHPTASTCPSYDSPSPRAPFAGFGALMRGLHSVVFSGMMVASGRTWLRR